MCEYMYQEGEKNNVQLVMCGIMKDYGRTSVEYKFYLEDHKIYKGSECKWLQQQLLVYNGNIAVAYSKLIDRELLLKNEILHDEVLRQGAEGLEFNLRLFEKLERAEFVDRPFYHYIYNESSISAAPTEENNEYVLKCFEKIKAFIDSSDNKEMLESWFDNRLLYVIITTAISGYFNPANKESFKERKIKFSEYLKKQIVDDALRTDNYDGLSIERKFTLFIIRKHLYFVLEMMGRIRMWQKKHR